jgi:type IV pilus assembly protein PilX
MKVKQLSGSQPQRQLGATLVVALIILATMTVLGVANLKSSSMQTSMARFSENREQAYQLAESILTQIETELVADRHDFRSVQDCAVGDTSCFDAECAGGECFNGTYSVGDSPWDCELDASSPPTYEAYWRDSGLDVWNTAGRHQSRPAPTGYAGFDDPKYIVEFLCYASTNIAAGQVCSTVASNINDCVALYRITSYARSRDGKARVMLQSITRVESI